MVMAIGGMVFSGNGTMLMRFVRLCGVVMVVVMVMAGLHRMPGLGMQKDCMHRHIV